MSEYILRISQAAELIRAADGLIITAGAGLGVDSKLPDYRTSKGLYTAACEAQTVVGEFAQMGSAFYLDTDPEGFWKFQWWLYQQFLDNEPHTGYQNLLRMASSRRHGYIVYTSNVDQYFVRAGFAANRVFECHGSMRWLQCARNCHYALYQTAHAYKDMKEHNRIVPVCPQCGVYLRPNTMMFDDMNWVDEGYLAQYQIIDKWLDDRRADSSKLVCIELGAGLAVPRVRNFTERLGCPIVRINPDKPLNSDLTNRSIVYLQGGALQVTDELMDQLSL